MDAESIPTPPPARSDALARATTLAKRASALRRAQVEVQNLTAREVQVMAKAAASFFNAIPLPEFTTSLLPPAARRLRRMRHRILHRTVSSTATGTMIHAMLLGRDGQLRLFSARTADTRDLLVSLEPGRSLPATVIRDVVEWTPTMRVDGFRPFEILEKLSLSLDSVEEQLAEAEAKVQVQKQALATGDLKALLPKAGAARVRRTPTPVMLPAITSTPSAEQIPPAPETIRLVVAPVASPSYVPENPFDLLATVEKVASAEPAPEPTSSEREAENDATATLRLALDDEPEEWDEPEPWDEPVPSSQPPQMIAAPRLSLFPVLPPPR